MEKYGKNDECVLLRFVGHSYGILGETISSKALGNYSASVWYNIFSICLWEELKLLISMISGILNGPFLPKTNYFDLWKHQDTKNNSGKFKKNIILRISEFGKPRMMTTPEKTDAEK